MLIDETSLPTYLTQGRVFKCRLPMPPTLNNLFPTSRRGIRFKSGEYKAWIALAELYWLQLGPQLMLEGRIAVTYTFHFAKLNKIGHKSGSRPDIFNFEKALSDFLVNVGIIRDDCDIDDGRVLRGAAADVAYVEVELSEL